MKIKLKVLIAIFVIFVCVSMNNTWAATFSVSKSSLSLNVGASSTITVTGSGVAGGPFTVTSSNSSVATATGLSTNWLENSSGTFTVTAKSAGTATITITGTVANLSNSSDESTVSKTVTVKVSAPTTNTSTNTSKPATNTASNNTKTTNNQKTNTNTSSKSNNAYLKSMIPSVEGLTPAFSKNIYSYSLKVGENVENISVKASVEHSRASYSVLGNTNLKSGENKVTVKVTAEDGTVKNYVINVLKSDNPVKADATLSSIIVEGATLSPEFDSNITEYDLGDIKVESGKLNIYAYPTNDNAKLEIVGYENLKSGENKVTIKVVSENSKVTKEYVLNFNKIGTDDKKTVETAKEEKAVNDDNESLGQKIKGTYNNMFKDKMPVILLYFFVWFEFIQVVYLYEKLKKYENGENSELKIKREKRKIEDEEK